MAIGPMSFRRISHEEANPFLTGALRSQQFGENMFLGPQKIEAARLANMIAQAQAQYAQPMEQAKLENQQNINKYYGPNIQSEMALRGAQTDLAGQQAQYYGPNIQSEMAFRNAQTQGQQNTNQFAPIKNQLELQQKLYDLQNPKKTGLAADLAAIENYYGGNPASPPSAQPTNNQASPGAPVMQPTTPAVTAPQTLGESGAGSAAEYLPKINEETRLSPKEKALAGAIEKKFPSKNEAEKYKEKLQTKRANDLEISVAKEATDANNLLGTANQMKEAYSRLNTSGWKGAITPDLSGAANDFNMAVNQLTLNNMQALRGLGAASERDLLAIQKLSPSTGSNQETVDKFVNSMKQMNDRAIEKQEFFTDNLQHHTPAQTEKAWNKYIDDYPMFATQESPKVAAKIQNINSKNALETVEKIKGQGAIIQDVQKRNDKYEFKVEGEWWSE